jgi:2-polyprenyl-6-methoxyphenol hydroxylase-like FAD-dependent oxidoreductase
MVSTNDADVVIVGAGPVGLVIALMIAKEGVKVTVLEANDEVIQSPRAMAYGPAAVNELERAGIAQDCRDAGLGEADYIRWITQDNELIAQIERPKDGYPPVICGQHIVAEIIMKHLSKYPGANILFNHKVKGIKDNGKTVTVVCQTENGDKELTARYVVGADGARSSARALIGCTFNGFTYDKMVVATNVHYPFQDYGFSFAQFIVHPDNFALVPPSPPHNKTNVEDRKSHKGWYVALLVWRRRNFDVRSSSSKHGEQV